MKRKAEINDFCIQTKKIHTFLKQLTNNFKEVKIV